MSVRLFDRVVVVDWSANAAPKRGADSIWIAVVDDRDGSCVVDNPSTRNQALDRLAGLDDPSRRTLIGVDFSLGYPAGTAAALGLGAPAWSATWAHLATSIIDDDQNRNNRFAVASDLNALIQAHTAGAGSQPTPGPFWGCPPAKATPTLSMTKPDRPAEWPSEWRLVEFQMRLRGHRPFAGWQLLGAGAVGGQSLVGIAALERLRTRLDDQMSVWPFTTGLGVPADRRFVVAEVWPSLWNVEVPVGGIKDAAQVEATARRLTELDRTGELVSLLSPQLPADEVQAVLDEEGWVLGVDTEHRGAACRGGER